MDFEKEARSRLIDRLGLNFLCFEEVRLEHAMFSRFTVRADVVAIPTDPAFWPYALAFEVKVPSQ